MNKAIPEPVTKLIEAFSRLPGVGPKSASRLTYFLLRMPDEVTLKLADALRDLKANTRFCSVCHNITVSDPCPVCSDPQRDQQTIMVVEDPLDVLAIERTGSYKGVYHVLHGVISPVNGVGPDDLKLRELGTRVENGDFLEVIVATNPSYEGDATLSYIKRDVLRGKGVKISELARGLPNGSDIEYADAVTLTRALQRRSEL
jgi:recombination protein RecR